MAVVSNGTTIIDAGALGSAAASGKMILIKTITISTDTNTADFIHGTSDVVFDSTYSTYVFKIINIHPASDNVRCGYNFTTDGSNFNVTKTTTFFNTYNFESGAGNALEYQPSQDLASGTGLSSFAPAVGNGNDESASAELTVFSPSSTTFVKHFTSRCMGVESRDIAQDNLVAGYANTTSALTGVRFQFFSGDIGSAVIKLYGIGG
tara:strand:- start:17 stop:637 length:621 start_codon:yes stop_codon:yes gene_type:complete